jgi:hypothetical protein
MTSLALPRVRSRRRKRRRMTPKERRAAFWTLWCVSFGVMDVVWAFQNPSILLGVFLLGCALCMVRIGRYWWPIVHAYIRHGWEDE